MPPASTTVIETKATQTKVVTHATPGEWVLLTDVERDRRSIVIQNRAAGSLFILEKDTAPGSGTQDGEWEVGATPASYTWPYRPRASLWVRGSVASMAISLLRF